MKLTIACMTALTAALLCAAPASAQVESGLHEVGARGSFDRGGYEFETRTTRINFDGYYGLFITDRIEVGPTLTFSHIEGLDATWGISGFTDVHFGDTSRKAVPYLGAAYGQTFGDEGSGGDPTFVSVGPGLKWFFGEGGGALNLSAFYRHRFFETGGAPNFATGVDEFGVKVGVAIFFGR